MWINGLSAQSRKKLLGRGVVGLFCLFLVVFLLLLAARQTPKFYRRWENVAQEKKVELNDSFVQKTLDLYSHFETRSEPWNFYFTDEELNGWLSVGAVKSTPELFSEEFHSPRIAIRGNVIELAAHVRYGIFRGVLHVKGTLLLHEPNSLILRLRSVKIGIYPLDRNIAVGILENLLEQNKIPFKRINDNGDIAVKMLLDFSEKNGKKIFIDSIKTDTGCCLVQGTMQI